MIDTAYQFKINENDQNNPQEKNINNKNEKSSSNNPTNKSFEMSSLKNSQQIKEESFKPIQKKIITKGPKERYVIDGWKLHEDLADISGYTWVIDIIDHFSKYMMFSLL